MIANNDDCVNGLFFVWCDVRWCGGFRLASVGVVSDVDQFRDMSRVVT